MTFTAATLLFLLPHLHLQTSVCTSVFPDSSASHVTAQHLTVWRQGEVAETDGSPSEERKRGAALVFGLPGVELG